MANTPNMNLDLPDVQSTPGPEYASKNNDAFGDIDSHDHTSGKGVRVPVAGLNINDDLPFSGNNLNSVRGVRLNNQSSEPTDPLDVRIVYAKNDELFYRDSGGNEVQITNGGSVAGATGAIANLVSPASAVYAPLADTFSFFHDSSRHAKFNVSNISLFEFTTGGGVPANSVTLASPTSLGSSYQWTLPTAQSSDATFQIVGVDSTGQLKYGVVTGTSNQINVSKTTSGYSVSTPQDIHTGASPTFAGATLTGTLTVPTGTASVPSLILGNTSAGISAPSNQLHFRANNQVVGLLRYGSESQIVNSTVAGGSSALSIDQLGTSAIANFKGSGTTVASITKAGYLVSKGALVEDFGVASGMSESYIKWEVFTGTITNNTLQFQVDGDIIGATGYYKESTTWRIISNDTGSSNVYFTNTTGLSPDGRIIRMTGSTAASKTYRILVYYT